MKLALFLVASLLIAANVLAEPVVNNRPPLPMPLATELVAECEVTVRFNEDEKSVKESEYPDSFICLGVMQGILGVNAYLDKPLFCLPFDGIKNWQAAKAIVEHAKRYPYKLTLLANEFAIEALKEAFPCSGQ